MSPFEPFFAFSFFSILTVAIFATWLLSAKSSPTN